MATHLLSPWRIWPDREDKKESFLTATGLYLYPFLVWILELTPHRDSADRPNWSRLDWADCPHLEKDYFKHIWQWLLASKLICQIKDCIFVYIKIKVGIVQSAYAYEPSGREAPGSSELEVFLGIRGIRKESTVSEHLLCAKC